MKTVLIAALMAGFLCLVPCLCAEAAVYGYVDAEGTAHFTDAPTKTHFRWLPAFGLPPGADLEQGQYAELIHNIAAENEVDPALVKAIIRTESNFNQHAVSRKGAQGLMQLMPGTAGRYAVGNAFDPAENIRGGVRYLRFLQDRFPGRLHLAVAAYNAGENAVLRYKGIPPYAETRQYVARVLGFYGRPVPDAAVSGQSSAGTERTPQAASSGKIYRQVASDGTPQYSNLPPLVRSPQGPAR